MSTFEHIVVVGCNGQFGQVLGRRLAAAGGALTGIDVSAVPGVDGLWRSYLQGSLEAPDTRMLDAVAAADLTLLCVPERVVVAGVGAVLERARADSCVADIASVKSRIAAAVGTAQPAAGYLSLHPMFGPSARFEGRNLAVVRLTENAATARLEALALGWSLRLAYFTADEHDRLSARVQAVPHALLLAAGQALVGSDVPLEAARDIATPVHDALLALLARILVAGNDTYWSIQADNPYAADARAALTAALGRIDSIARDNDEAAFGRLVDELTQYLGGDLEDLLARAEALTRAATGRER